MIVIPVMAKADDKTVSIGMGERAPFDGFLLPPRQFNKLNQDLIEKDFMEQKIKDCGSPQLRDTFGEIQSNLLWFMAGLFGGLILHNMAVK